MSSWTIILGILGGFGVIVGVRWLTRKSALDAASVFLKSRNRRYDEYGDY